MVRFGLFTRFSGSPIIIQGRITRMEIGEMTGEVNYAERIEYLIEFGFVSSGTELAKILGARVATVNCWRNGKSIPSKKYMEKMCEKFNLISDYFTSDEFDRNYHYWVYLYHASDKSMRDYYISHISYDIKCQKSIHR